MPQWEIDPVDQQDPGAREDTADERKVTEDGPEPAGHLGPVHDRLAALAGAGEADQGGDHGNAEEAQLQGWGPRKIQCGEAGDHREHPGGVPAAVTAAGCAVDDLVAALGDLREIGLSVLEVVHSDSSTFDLPGRKVNRLLSCQAVRHAIIGKVTGPRCRAERRSAPKPPALLTSRSARVLLFAVLYGIGAGLLTYFARPSTPEAFLAAGVAAPPGSTPLSCVNAEGDSPVRTEPGVRQARSGRIHGMGTEFADKSAEMFRALADGELGLFRSSLRQVFQLSPRVPLEERAALSNEIAPLLSAEDGDLELVADLAVLAGALVEGGVPPGTAGMQVMRMLHAWAGSIDTLREAGGRHSVARRLGLAAKTMLTDADVRAAVRADERMLYDLEVAAGRLRLNVSEFQEVERLIMMADAVSALVLDRRSGRGFRVAFDGVWSNFQLHTLLADALIGTEGRGLEGERPLFRLCRDRERPTAAHP